MAPDFVVATVGCWMLAAGVCLRVAGSVLLGFMVLAIVYARVPAGGMVVMYGCSPSARWKDMSGRGLRLIVR